MNIGYVIDLNGTIKADAFCIPDLSGLYYKSSDSNKLSLRQILDFRDEVLNDKIEAIEKHLFFFVIENDKETLKSLSKCIDEIQKDQIHFNQSQNELHVVCNLTQAGGFGLGEYEKGLPSLQNNAVCVYSWILDEYDFTGAKKIASDRRAHAIARLIWMVCRHRGDLSLQQMHIDRSPIYNLFGDSCVFFNDQERDGAVRNFYYFKSLQHLLNLPDAKLDDYLAEHVLPYKDTISELDKRIEISSGTFLKEQRVPIEATLITEKTQGLLIKSSDDDQEYLVNASDNKLVFIDELSHNQQWQLQDTDKFVSDYRHRIGHAEENQEALSDEFLKALHDTLTIHNRSRFDEINNEVSKSRREHVEDFKQKIDKHLLGFLNKKEHDNYATLSETLTPQDVKRHCSNIDYGIAFMEYLEAGNGDYLVDIKVSTGDTNFKIIKESLEVEENRRLSELNGKEKEIKEKYEPQKDDNPSVIKAKFGEIDRAIKKFKEDIRQCNFQLGKWYDEDAVKKLTARTRSVIALGSGILAAIIWLFASYQWIKPVEEEVIKPIKNFFEILGMDGLANKFDFSRYQWSIFVLLLLIGIIIGVLIIVKIVRQRKVAEEALKNIIHKKERLMHDCMEDMKELVEKRYKHLLAFHGMKTIVELAEYVKWKKEDLMNFKKTLFKLLLQYKLSIPKEKQVLPNDFNTIELNDIDVKRLLFGTEENRKTVPYCFAHGGVTLSETFDNFRRKKVKFETTKFSLGHASQNDFDQMAIEKEVIPARKQDEKAGIEYSALKATSALPNTSGIGMDDIHQGFCGDCYFMATLASIAKMNPEYIIGKNGLVEEIGEKHKFFRVKFYDKDGNRVNVDVDNRFWNKNDKPYYAGIGKSSDAETYDPWVMAVEKAWAKANNDGYDGIEGASGDGLERVRKVEYSFAVTGKSAFYCMTRNVPDKNNLLSMMKKHFNEDKLPITLYSASPDDPSFANRDQFIVSNHAYALRSIHEDGTFDIFNPWNSYAADEELRGKHYEKVDIDFIKDNFDVVVFFGIKEADFASFERDLTNNAIEKEVTQVIEKVLDEGLSKLALDTHNIEELMTDDVMENAYVNATYLFSRNRVKDERGVNKDEQHLMYLEGGRNCDKANDKMLTYLLGRGQINVQPILRRDDDKQNLTLLRVSPHYVLANFHDLKG